MVFTNPLLISAELWHFLGYDGVFIAYAWPSTPKTLAYAADLETTALSAHFLQMLIQLQTSMAWQYNFAALPGFVYKIYYSGQLPSNTSTAGPVI